MSVINITSHADDPLIYPHVAVTQSTHYNVTYHFILVYIIV